MHKLIYVLRKKNELSVERFQEYWLKKNSQIAKKLPLLVRYVQSHTLLSVYKKMIPASDGIVEFWFDNYKDFQKVEGSQEFERLKRDDLNFVDIDKTIQMHVIEEVIKDNEISLNGVKNIELVVRKRGMAVDVFQKYWKEIHGPLGSSIKTVNRYVQNHVVARAYEKNDRPKFDGLAITWFDSTRKMKESALSEEYMVTRDDEENFLTIPLDFIITKEHVIVK